MIIFGIALIGIGFFLSQKAEAGDYLMIGSQRLFSLPDIEPSQQGGNFKRDYDFYFETVADETGVPFALLKAHAIRESNLDPRAFRDENPDKIARKSGWVSRGLMQVLFWPKSTRFENLGFSSVDLKDGEALWDPYVNLKVAGLLIKANLKACSGNLRDAVNMYNTGKKESQYPAPHDYVNKVISSYETLIKRSVS